EVDEQQALELLRRLETDAAPAKLRHDRKAPGLGDPVALVHAMERNRAGVRAVNLDDEPTERVGLTRGVLDLLEDRVARLPGAPAEERARLLVRDEAEQEVGVLGTRATERHRHGAGTTSRRRRTCQTPEPSPTPPRMSAS